MNEITAVPLATPVVFIVFNRPDCTARSLAAIRAAQPRRLYLVADGPRPDRVGEAARCAETRTIVERGVDWPCELIRDYAPANLGCAQRVISGLNAVFARESEAIILEDDCLAGPDFFRFSAELLERYREDPRVWQIGGANFQPQARNQTYYFSRYNHIWGWAAWRRSWQRADWEMKDWPSVRDSSWLSGFLGDPGAARYWRDAFDSAFSGAVDSWAYRWTYAMWRQGALAVLPGTNLVSNIGFGVDATHSESAGHQLCRPAMDLNFPLVHPGEVVADASADRHTERMLYSGSSLRRLRRSLGRAWRAVAGAR